MERWRFTRVAGALAALVLACPPAPAGTAGALPAASIFYPGADHDPAAPTFREVLGFEPGAWIVSPAGARAYLEALAGASPRMRVEQYGRTYEGRPLLLATISSPDNLARLEAVRADLARLQDPRRLGGAEERDAILARSPVVVWLAYSVHGDEHSGTEAALLTAHHLAADRSEETRGWLQDVVVLIDPMQNPDGRSRFLRWQEAMVARGPDGRPRPDPAPEAAEHHQPWPGGRFNHYLFDLNRDWFFATQVETRARVELLQRWNPQVFVDLHEMGTDETYFFPPPAPPINPFIPDPMLRWWEVFGAGNARMLDRFGVDYYTGEVFDAFYPGYGDSFPTLNGAIGMTYEQASARGLAQRRADGTVLTLREAIWHHFLTSLATVRTASENRRACLRDYASIFDAAVRSASGPRELWIEPGSGPGGARELAALLSTLGIEVLHPEGKVTNDSLVPVVEGQVASPELPEGGFLIPLEQPRRRLIETLFAREVQIDPGFLRAEEEKRRRQEPSGFYDITAWSLPLAYGVQAFRAERRSSGPTATSPPPPVSGVEGPEGAVAYLLPYLDNAGARALVELLTSEGLRLQVAREPFRAGGRDYGRGTLVVKASTNPPDLRARLRAAAERHGVRFQGVPSFRTEDGVDLGSRKVVPVRMPRIGLLFGAPASPTSAGWLSYLLEQKLDVPYTRLHPGRLGGATIGELDVLIAPDSDPLGGEYVEWLGPSALERLAAWIDAGGVFVGIGGGAALAARPEVAWASSRLVTLEDPSDAAGIGRGTGRDLRLEDLPEEAPGAIARVLLDETHFLSLGYRDWLAVPVVTRLAFVSGEKGKVAATYDGPERLRLSGFMWDDTREALADRAWLVSEERGDGKLILFAGDPAFRAFWPNLNRLLLNAILLAPSM